VGTTSARRAGILALGLAAWAVVGVQTAVHLSGAAVAFLRRRGIPDPIRSAGFIPLRVELPVPLLFVPAAVLALRAWRGPRSAGARRSLLVLACVALGTAVLPIALTTAGALETQAFVLAYLLAAPLFLAPEETP
jgi:hypothetical protein